MGVLDYFRSKSAGNRKTWISIPAEYGNLGDRQATLPEAIVGKMGTQRRSPGRVSPTVLSYVHGVNPQRGSFQRPEYDLAEIAKAIDTESLLQLAVSQLRNRILREQWTIKGRNDETVAYIMRRIRELELATNGTFDNLLRQVVSNLVLYSNAFIVKVRNSARSSGQVVRRYGRDLAPVAGMFSGDPTSMEVRRTVNGVPTKWQQTIPGVDDREFRTENVVHITYDRKDGFAFGTPWVVPVLDDIRALRRLEELVEILVGKHIFPLFHYRVGSDQNPAMEFDDGSSEIDMVRANVEFMPTEGSIVTSERHEITAISPQLVDATDYLAYFSQRVKTGLRVSNVDSGEGNTANRATAGFMNVAKDDLAKDMQDVLCNNINFYIFDEWLEEGGFPLNEDNRVLLFWPPIDPEEQRLRDAHVALLYQNNLITEDEARMEMGRQPMIDGQRTSLHLELITKPTLELQGQIKAQQAAQNSLNSVNKPTNQSGTKPARTKPKNDDEDFYARFVKDTLEREPELRVEHTQEVETIDNYSLAMGNLINSIIDEFGEQGIDMGAGEDGLDRATIQEYRARFNDATLSAAQRKKLTSSTFCGPGRSFPVNDCAHFTAALRLLPRFKGGGDKGAIRSCIMGRGRKLGCPGAKNKDKD